MVLKGLRGFLRASKGFYGFEGVSNRDSEGFHMSNFIREEEIEGGSLKVGHGRFSHEMKVIAGWCETLQADWIEIRSSCSFVRYSSKMYMIND